MLPCLRRENREIPTKHILTFRSTTLPTKIVTAYLKLPVRPYIAKPYIGKRFGHGCRGHLTCAKCDTSGHCANCDGHHPAYSRSSAAWKRKKEIRPTKVSLCKTRQRVSLHFSENTSYAEVVRGVSAPLRSWAVTRTMHGMLRQAPPSLNSAKEVPLTSDLVGQRLSRTRRSPPHEHTSLEPNASQEVMDTTSSPPEQAVPKGRQESLDHPNKTPVTVPVFKPSPKD